MQIQLAEFGGRVRQIFWCSKLVCQQATTDLQMKPGTMSELGWVLDITMEQFMMSKHQHKPAASTAACG